MYNSNYFVGRSKNGFLDEAETAMPIINLTSEPPPPSGTPPKTVGEYEESPIQPSCSTATPMEYITRVSRRRSAAVAQAEPTAMPTSILFNEHGTWN